MQTKRAAYAAEFLGTFMLVLFIGLILASNSKAGLGSTDFAVVGLLHAFVLTMLVATLGALSGAHFNPAVTITLRALRKIGSADAAAYIAAQLAGAVCAALVVRLVLTSPAEATHYGATAVNKTFVSGDAGAAAAELIGTFALMWAILGAGLNPARAFGPALVGNAFGGAGSFLLVYVLAPIAGALLAGAGYRLIALEPPVAAPVPETAQEPFAA